MELIGVIALTSVITVFATLALSILIIRVING